MTDTTTLPVPGQALRASMERCASHGMTLFTHHLKRREDGTALLLFGCQACFEADQEANYA